MQIRHGIRLATGVHEVDPHRPFEFLVANFSHVERSLPTGIVIGAALNNQLAIVSPEPSIAHEFALALNTAQVPCEKRDSTGVDSREEPHGVDKWEAVSLSKK